MKIELISLRGMLLPYSSKNLTCIVALAVVVWKNAYFKLPSLNTIPTFPGKRVAQYQKKKKDRKNVAL